MKSCRRVLSHLAAVCIGVYAGLLFNSNLHLDASRTFSIDRQIQISSISKCNETQRDGSPVPPNGIDARALKNTGGIRHSICQRLGGDATPTALSYWTRHAKQVHAATQLTPYDKKYHFHDFTAQLLHLVSPRMPHSVLSVPHDWSVVEQILEKAVARYEYLQDSKNKPFQPPVKMVILGGSVLVGRNCRKLMKDLDIQGMLLPNRACTWAFRLQIFMDQILQQPGVMEITKISMGGTNTAVGAQIFEYDLLPEAARNPDIVLNAYSTNDMHILTTLQAKSGNQTLRDRVFEITQEFVRVVLQKRPLCQTHHQPLLLHVDDYLGNEQRQVWATTELSQGVSVLAHYYGFATMSYANIVRQWVYGDTRETWFSPEGWYDGTKTTEMKREIHPGMGMHITATWVVAYNLLNLVTTFCSLEPWLAEQSQDSMDYSKSWLADTIPLTGYKSDVPGKPKIPPQILPPLLTQELSLETISSDWQVADELQRSSLESINCSKQAGLPRCIFSWVSGMSQQHDNKTWVEEYFGANQIENKGWKLVDEGGKLGFSPLAVGDEVALEFMLSQDIQTVTFFTLKSYGPKWEHSKLLVTIEGRSGNGDWEEVGRDEILGVHNKETSEVYTRAIKLADEAKEGTLLRIRYKLESGATFKVMGLAVCS